MNIIEMNKNIAIKTKETNIPFVLNEDALRGLVERIAGKTYADKILFRQIFA